MPKRFMITADVFLVEGSPKQAGEVLHKVGASRTIDGVHLATDANQCLVIPDGEVLVMMGTTPELTQELEKLRTSGAKSFVPGQPGTSFLPRYAGRINTSEDGGMGYKHTVSVIVLCGSARSFDENSWTKLLGGGSLSVATLIDTELAKIKALPVQD